jgi:hypothetical protein
MWDYWPWLVLLVGLHAGLVVVLVRRISAQVAALEQAILLHQRREAPAWWEEDGDGPA